MTSGASIGSNRERPQYDVENAGGGAEGPASAPGFPSPSPVCGSLVLACSARSRSSSTAACDSVVSSIERATSSPRCPPTPSEGQGRLLGDLRACPTAPSPERRPWPRPAAGPGRSPRSGAISSRPPSSASKPTSSTWSRSCASRSSTGAASATRTSYRSIKSSRTSLRQEPQHAVAEEAKSLRHVGLDYAQRRPRQRPRDVRRASARRTVTGTSPPFARPGRPSSGGSGQGRRSRWCRSTSPPGDAVGLRKQDGR